MSEANLPIQKHPFDQTGKVFVNKEWYLALLGLVQQSNSNSSQPSVTDITILEAVDQGLDSDPQSSTVIRNLSVLTQIGDSIDEVSLTKRVRDLEILVSLIAELGDSSALSYGGFFDEKGASGTPGFSAGTDFVAGTTTTLTLSQNYASAANLWIHFDAAFQGPDQYSLSGRTLTFTSAIPLGTSKVFVKGFV